MIKKPAKPLEPEKPKCDKAERMKAYAKNNIPKPKVKWKPLAEKWLKPSNPEDLGIEENDEMNQLINGSPDGHAEREMLEQKHMEYLAEVD